MSDQDSILVKKMSGQRVGRSPIPEIEEIAENFARLLDDRLRPLLRTITGAMVLDCEVKKLSRVLEDIPVPAMIGVIKVAGSQNSTLVNVGTDLIYHIVDLRMGGDPASMATPTARSITEIDSALCADAMSAIVTSFEAAVRMNLGPGASARMSFDRFEQHVTMVRIAPEHADVLVVTVSLDIGEAARSGEFDFVIPLSVLDQYKAAAAHAPVVAPTTNEADLWTDRMMRAATESQVKLVSIIHRAEISVDELQSLSVGDIIEMPADRRDAVGIAIESEGAGPVIAEGRLGVFEGRRAVKLTRPPARTLQDHIRALTAQKEDA